MLYNSVHYLGPLREDPSPSYRPGQRGGIATLGRKGEFTIAILNSYRTQPAERLLEQPELHLHPGPARLWNTEPRRSP